MVRPKKIMLKYSKGFFVPNFTRMPLKSIEKEKRDSDTSFVLFGLFISNRPRIMTLREMWKGSRRGGK